MVFLPLSEMTVDLDNMEAYYEKRRKRYYRLVKSPDNNRRRSKISQKYIYQKFNFESVSKKKEVMLGQVGHRWALQVKGKKNAFPSLNEVFKGLNEYVSDVL